MQISCFPFFSTITSDRITFVSGAIQKSVFKKNRDERSNSFQSCSTISSDMALLSAFQVRKAELLKPLKWFARHFTDRGKSRGKDLKPEILIRKTRIVRVHRESSR